MLTQKKRIFEYNKLYKVVKVITKNLNKIIDINFYPLPETERSNKRHRPMGIGVQGLADVFAMLKVSFDSDDAKKINEKIFETIYYSALETSVEISKKREQKMKKLKDLRNKSECSDEETNIKKMLEDELKPLEMKNYQEINILVPIHHLKVVRQAKAYFSLICGIQVHLKTQNTNGIN